MDFLARLVMKNAAAAVSNANKKNASESNYKETIESILIAFILAFIFRAFVVEAFVIPTGSMAPTLYGAHMRYHCPDCGYVFDAGFRGKNSALGDDVDIPPDAVPLTTFHCPNCGYAMPKTSQPVRFGDRILVLKYLYLMQSPVRWDVVVFKSPHEDEDKHDPIDPEYAQNYIKRLVGIGPESVVILDGNLYTGSFDAEKPLDAAGKPLFTIQRKPNYVQDALWRVVYDNDFIPHFGKSPSRTESWGQPWTEENPGSGWTLAGQVAENWPAGRPSRIFAFANPNDAGAITFTPDAVPNTNFLTDFLVYDEEEHNNMTQGWDPLSVSDLKLGCDYTRTAGDGPLRLQLSKYGDVFTAEFTRGKVRLLKASRVSPDRPAIVDEHLIGEVAESSLAGKATARIELINVDYRVSVRVNGRVLLSTTDADYSPPLKALWEHEEAQYRARRPIPLAFNKPMVRIEAAQQMATIEHVALSRDIHYLSLAHPSSTDFVYSSTTRKISHLKAGEYFVMGDNSFISGDARYWRDRVELPREDLDVDSGRVPERFMLGKAFFVYWPAGYPLPIVNVNAVPDFGEMRSIR